MILESYWASSINQMLKEWMETDLSVTTHTPLCISCAILFKLHLKLGYVWFQSCEQGKAAVTQTGQRSVWGNSQWPGQCRTEEAPAHSLPWQYSSPLLTLPQLTLTPGAQNCSLYTGHAGCSNSSTVTELLAVYGVHRSTNHELNTHREWGFAMKCVCSQETTKPVNNRFLGH